MNEPLPGSKLYWEKIYKERKPDEVSWFQTRPRTSLELLAKAGLNAQSRVIDVGGGASTLVDALLELGVRKPTVLDLSGFALAHARERLGEKASLVDWVEADVTTFAPAAPYDYWHDRAVFHFLTTSEGRSAYLAALKRSLKPAGHALLAAFGPDGPEKCSGLPVCRYDGQGLSNELGAEFVLKSEQTEEHRTPWDAVQLFRYCLFQRASSPNSPS